MALLLSPHPRQAVSLSGFLSDLCKEPASKETVHALSDMRHLFSSTDLLFSHSDHFQQTLQIPVHSVQPYRFRYAKASQDLSPSGIQAHVLFQIQMQPHHLPAPRFLPLSGSHLHRLPSSFLQILRPVSLLLPPLSR